MDYGFFPQARITSKFDSRSWTDWFILKEWFREKNVRKEKKNGNHKCIREALEKPFPELKSQSGAFQLMRCLSGGW